MAAVMILLSMMANIFRRVRERRLLVPTCPSVYPSVHIHEYFRASQWSDFFKKKKLILVTFIRVSRNTKFGRNLTTEL